MAESLKRSALPRALSEVFADLADLVQKEIRLARTELSDKLSIKVRAGIWAAAAAGIGIIALLLIVQAAVLGLAAATGLALHWSCLIVAAFLVALAGATFAKGKADAEQELSPNRTIHQVQQDIATVKEQFS
jgi:hypothetical protein